MTPIATALGAILLCIAPGLACAAAGPPAVPDAAARHAFQCQLGRQIVDEWRSGSAPYPRRLEDRPVRHGSFAVSNPSPLIKRWAEASPSNVFTACPELRARAGQDSFPSAEEREAARAIPGSRFISIDSFTAPFLDAAGTTAIVQYSGACPGLCGSGWITRYERRQGVWVKTGTLGLWVS